MRNLRLFLAFTVAAGLSGLVLMYFTIPVIQFSHERYSESMDTALLYKQSFPIFAFGAAYALKLMVIVFTTLFLMLYAWVVPFWLNSYIYEHQDVTRMMKAIEADIESGENKLAKVVFARTVFPFNNHHAFKDSWEHPPDGFEGDPH